MGSHSYMKLSINVEPILAIAKPKGSFRQTSLTLLPSHKYSFSKNIYTRFIFLSTCLSLNDSFLDFFRSLYNFADLNFSFSWRFLLSVTR